MEYQVKDSGKRVKYASGAVRDVEEDKIRWDLIPLEALERVAIHYTKGAKKYGDDNWKKGVPDKRLRRSLLRHTIQELLGQTDEDHKAAIVFNALALIYNEEMGISIQDETID
ncbi:MAG: dATP/dGTP diphosphohydrolase domain-containing protein [Eubacteriales bacterium]